MGEFRTNLFGALAIFAVALTTVDPAVAATSTTNVGVCASFPASISTPDIVNDDNIVQFVASLVAGDTVSFSGLVTFDSQGNPGVVAQVTGSSGATILFTTNGTIALAIVPFSTTFTVASAGTYVFEVATGGERSQINANVSCVPAPTVPTNSSGAPLTTPQVMAQTSTAISRIIKTRIPGMVADEPDLVSRLRIGRGMKPGAVSLFGYARRDRSNVKFATGAAQLQNSLSKASANYGPTSDSDFWVEGRFSHSTTSAQNNVLAIFYASFDRLVTEDLLIGAMGQVDWSEDWSRISNASARSLGWMAGPYFVFRPFENIYIDARAAYGTSAGSLKPFGTYADNFQTQRWLLRAQLTGDFKVSEYRISPMAQIVYFSETQNAYTDALGNGISAQNVSLGRFTSGVEFARTWYLQNGAMLAPQLAFKAVWDFAGDGATRIQGLASFIDDFHGRVEAGFRYTTNTGHQFSLEGFYDGIGNNDFSMIGGRIRLVIPLI